MDRLRILSSLSSATSESVDAGQLLRKINKGHRNSVLKWLFESLDLLKVEDSVFFATVLLSDRYCCKLAHSRRLEGADLQLVILASLCCSLKVVDSSVDLSVKAFIEHVSGGHVDAKDIFMTEARILRLLNFDAFVPSLSEFVTSFYEMLLENKSTTSSPLEQEVRRMQLPAIIRRKREMSIFLLYLTVLDVERFHSMDLPTLVSSCILSGAWIVSSSRNRASTEEIAREVSPIADGLIHGGWLSEQEDFLGIIQETVAFWEVTMSKPSEAVTSLKRIFGSNDRCEVATITLNDPRIMSSGG